MGPQSVQVGWVSCPLERNGQFLDTLGKGGWGLQLLHKHTKGKCVICYFSGQELHEVINT